MTKLLPQETLQTLLPTEADVEFYNEHGWYISKKLFSDAEIDNANLGAERHYRGERDATLPAPIKKYLDWQPSDGDGLRINDYVAYMNREIRALLSNPLIGTTAAMLSAQRGIRLFNSSLVYKPARENGADYRVGWHADRAYWKTCTSDDMLTAWIPLHDCDEDMGTLAVIDGSHRWSPTDERVRVLQQEKNFICRDFEGLETRLRDLGMPLKIVPLEMKKGQCSFHHCLTFHGSGPNRTSTARRAVIFHLQDHGNRYRRAIDAAGEPVVYNNDLMCRKTQAGDPDYADPRFCPELWPAPVPAEIPALAQAGLL
jgi:hypothetical protein